jgi:chromosome segregation ATPase
MKTDGKLMVNGTENDSIVNRIFDKLDWMIHFFGSELGRKQQHIQELQSEVAALKTKLAEKDTSIEALKTKLAQISETEEANRQLVNKLLSDISRYENDIGWYRRTYERRSLLGLFKEKFFK